MVLLGHQAEPLNCWLAPEQMTVRSDREYFEEHPQYYMYRHPEMPSHDAILAARDRMLRAHPRAAVRRRAPRVTRVGRRQGWRISWSAFPDARVDVAARMVHLEYQAASNAEKIRRFLIRYQDRILYGSDDSYGPDDQDARAVADIHKGWLEDWRFLATSDAMHSEDFTAAFHGLQLPRAVLEKIYRRNAEKLFAGAWKEGVPASR